MKNFCQRRCFLFQCGGTQREKFIEPAALGLGASARTVGRTGLSNKSIKNIKYLICSYVIGLFHSNVHDKYGHAKQYVQITKVTFYRFYFENLHF
ncbi:PREDICTED: uncharacterized protein LOC106749203 isoform X4 [Dinoponera quadriceps]|uniref:Uncharacterized protein LOC106749203 isoform X4 n=1 Tax=Dinoponera quadriceps TaxID=609295 RepID=A0A6P3Y109_DINQU|nr:PREDICTED: uncharacterized protein LOC106749203 isoform X4 [Dinoponera quadriceps]